MSNIFLVSDTHFGHSNILNFKNADGSNLRTFDSVEHMDEHMIAQWNKVVKPSSKVYHLGDVVINRRALPIMDRLNGDKVLIRGNHDIFPDVEYRKYFRELRAYHVMNGMILSHIPIHSDSLGRFGVNIHGHLHGSRVTKATGVDPITGAVQYGNEIDPRYHCVCVEQTDFAPILFEDVIQRIEEEGGVVGFRNGNGPTM